MPKPEGEGAETNVGICATGWTELRQTSRMNGPICGVQILNFLEVAVTGDKDHLVTFRRGGDPDVVLGKGPPLLLQVLF